MVARIIDINASEILDSRGNPTIEAEVILENGLNASASVPSGASKGSHEALELRDGDNSRFGGLGVLKVLSNVEKRIRPLLIGLEITQQKEIDKKMIEADGTSNKGNLGANSILSVSLAAARTAAKSLNLPLYKYIQRLTDSPKKFKTVTPIFNVINGGLHGSGRLDFQEFFFIPSSFKSFFEALQTGVELYQQLKNLLKTKRLSYSLGDEGGFTPNLSSNRLALEVLAETIKESQYKYREDIYLGLDLAASTFYQNNFYKLNEKNTSLTKEEYVDYLLSLTKEFGLFLLEDPLFEDDWGNWIRLTKSIGSSTMIVGDDLLVTNKRRLEKAIKVKACNSILVKVNQIGTLTEALKVIKIAKEAGFKIIISHRSGETNDDFIADLAVGVGADFVKFGAPARGERVAKYNRLLEIYQELSI